jgi:hypothetical protein
VTISIKDLLARTGTRNVHDAFMLDPDTRVIALGVAKDHELEKSGRPRALRKPRAAVRPQANMGRMSHRKGRALWRYREARKA